MNDKNISAAILPRGPAIRNGEKTLNELTNVRAILNFRD